MRHSEFDSVIFDLDGLLIDSEPIFRAAWQRACRECGFELSNDQHRQLTGRGRKGALEFVQSLSSAQLDLGRLSELLDKYERGFFNQNPPVLKPGAAEILKALPAAGKGIALATSTRRARAIEKLEVCKLATCFDVVVCGDEVSRGKPAPDIFLRAAELLQSQPERCTNSLA